MLKKLYPRFLKNFDHYLLTHYPVIWKSRIHVFAFFSLLLGNLLAFGAGHLFPISKTNMLTTGDYSTLQQFAVILMLFIGLGYMLLQRRFPLTQVDVWKRVLIIPLYALCLTSVVMNVSVFQHALVSRVAAVVPDATFEEDEKLAKQLMIYRENVDNFSQNNINVEKVKRLGKAYGIGGLEYDITDGYKNYSDGRRLEQIIGSISSAKYYRDQYDLEGFLNTSGYEYGDSHYFVPLSKFPKMRGEFWNASIFLIGFFSLLTFLATYFESKAVLASIFGLFIFWMFSMLFVGTSFAFIGVNSYLLALFAGVIPFLWQKKTAISRWIAGFAILLLYILGYFFLMIKMDSNDFFMNSMLLVFAMELMFGVLLVYIMFLLKKELAPQQVN